MLHHPCIAVITADLMPAGPANRYRGKAATVQEQQRLFALFHPRCDLTGQCFRNPAIPRQPFLAHVDRLHGWQFRRPEPRPQIQPRILARLDIHPTLKAWRRRGQHNRCPHNRRPKHRHIARVIKNAFLLLVASIMFLIDHDQPKLLKRQE